MKSTNKIQAFTLSEIVVVLVLTSIVVGLAFMVLSLVQNRVHIIRENLNRNAEINKLKLSMTLDLNRFNIASFSLVDNELKLLSPLTINALYSSNSFFAFILSSFFYYLWYIIDFINICGV